jgi:hypothetical protein
MNMEVPMPNEVVPNHNDASASRLPPFPVEFLDLPDEQLAIAAWVWWVSANLVKWGIPLDRATPEDVEHVRIATLALDTDNQALAGLEKAHLLMAAGNPEDRSRAGRMIREYFAQRVTHISALNELATGHHRQSAVAKSARPDYLQHVLTKILERRLDTTPLEAKEELKRRVGAPGEEPRIHCVDEDAGEVQWFEKGKPERQSAPLSGLKDRLSKGRKALRKN